MPTLGADNLQQINLEVAEVFGLATVSRNEKWDQVMRQKTPGRKDEKVTIVKLDNSVSNVADGGAYQPSTVKEIGAYTITQKIYKDSVTLGDFAEEFDNYGAIRQSALEKGLDYAYERDQLAADFFNNPTSTTAPYGFQVNGSSKTPLLSNTQPIGDTGLTQDNLVTGGLGYDTFFDALDLLKLQKRHNGNKAGYQAARLLYPTKKFKVAQELLYSKGTPEDANTAKNPIPGLGVIGLEWDLLTDDDNCFLMAPMMVTPSMIYFIKKNPSMRVIRNQQTGNVDYQFDMMLQAGIADYQGVVGITG